MSGMTEERWEKRRALLRALSKQYIPVTGCSLSVDDPLNELLMMRSEGLVSSQRFRARKPLRWTITDDGLDWLDQTDADMANLDRHMGQEATP